MRSELKCSRTNIYFSSIIYSFLSSFNYDILNTPLGYSSFTYQLTIQEGSYSSFFINKFQPLNLFPLGFLCFLPVSSLYSISSEITFISDLRMVLLLVLLVLVVLKKYLFIRFLHSRHSSGPITLLFKSQSSNISLKSMIGWYLREAIEYIPLVSFRFMASRDYRLILAYILFIEYL